MKRLLTLTSAMLLLLAFSVSAAGLDAAAQYRVFLPVVQRGYRRPEACLPRFALPEMLVLELDRPPGLDMIHTGDFDGNGWTDVVVARLDFGTTRTFEIDILLNDGQGHL